MKDLDNRLLARAAQHRISLIQSLLPSRDRKGV